MKTVSSAQLVLPEMPSGVLPLAAVNFKPAPLLEDLLVDISNVRWVRTPLELEALADRLGRLDSFAIDTETGAAIDPTTGAPYLDQELSAHLSLVQIAVSEEEFYIVDVLALSPGAKIDDFSALEPLRDVLSNPEIEKIMHFCAFEREQFLRYGIELAGVYDTYSVARRFRPDLPTHTLAACLWEICGLRISKEAQDAPWMMRPLRDEWIEYAARDPIAALRLRQSFKELEEGIQTARCTDASESLRSIPNVYAQALDQVRPIAAQYFLLGLRAANLRAAIEKRLLERTKKVFDREKVSLIEQPDDSAHALRAREYRIDYTRLEQLHPAAYSELLRWRVSIDLLRDHLVQAPLLKTSDQVERIMRNLIVTDDRVRISEFSPAFRSCYRLPQLSERQELEYYFGPHVCAAAKLYRELRDFISLLRPDLQAAGVFAAVREMQPSEQLMDTSDPATFKQNLAALSSCHATALAQVNDAQVDYRSWSVAQMCSALLDTKREQLDLMRHGELGKRYWFLRALQHQHEIDAKERFLAASNGQQTASLSDELGGVMRATQGQRMLSIELMRENYPEYFAALASKGVSQHEIRRYLLARGLTRQECELVTSVVMEPASYSARWSVRISPRYAQLYKFTA